MIQSYPIQGVDTIYSPATNQLLARQVSTHALLAYSALVAHDVDADTAALEQTFPATALSLRGR